MKINPFGVEDGKGFSQVLVHNLEKDGYVVLSSRNRKDGLYLELKDIRI